MRSLHFAGSNLVELEEIPAPAPGEGEALVRIEASAVCGSERGALANGLPARNSGHEAAGIVEQAPSGSRFEIGERVGLCAVSGCGQCDMCAAGRELHCRTGPRVGGGWHAEYATSPISALRKLPDGTDAGLGAIISGDPLGVPARAMRRIPHDAGQRVLVIGLGPVGLGHVVVRAFAGAHVVGVEPSEYRRDLARTLGAAELYAPGDDTGPAAPIVIESTGRPDCIELALRLVDNYGTVIQSGECHQQVPMSPSDTFIRREITYTGAWYYASEDYPSMLDLVARGLPLERLRTHDVAAADAQGAIDDFVDARSGKVVLRWA